MSFASTSVKTRLALVNPDKCKPKKCKQECKNSCPVVRMGKLCIEVDSSSKISQISESLCIGCGICVKKCPFEAIQIINLPDELTVPITFRYSSNSFQLHRLPMPRRKEILGLVGKNGIGKSTLVKIMSNHIKPNFGKYNEKITDEEIVKKFRGSDLQHYLEKLYLGDLKVKVKPQHIEALKFGTKTVQKTSLTVREILEKYRNHPDYNFFLEHYELSVLLDRESDILSGGELQRLCLMAISCQDADMIVIDEGSNYLDIQQRLKFAKALHHIIQRESTTYMIVIEHDLAVLDYIADFISCLYGVAGAFGIVSLPYSTREGLNMYLEGFLPAENIRIRDHNLRFAHSTSDDETSIEFVPFASYPKFSINFDNIFRLDVKPGNLCTSEIILLLGANGSGKTSLVRTFAGLVKESISPADTVIPEMYVSFKPQKIIPKFEGNVRQFLYNKVPHIFSDELFKSDILEPLEIKSLLNLNVQNLSGGELQRVAITLAMGKKADLYLFDEPSSMVDVEMRLAIATGIRRYIKHTKKTAWVVEHDIVMGLYLADRIICFSGEKGIHCEASSPMGRIEGINTFLMQLGITMRQDSVSKRPRINKIDSVRDREQKKDGKYYIFE